MSGVSDAQWLTVGVGGGCDVALDLLTVLEATVKSASSADTDAADAHTADPNAHTHTHTHTGTQADDTRVDSTQVNTQADGGAAATACRESTRDADGKRECRLGCCPTAEGFGRSAAPYYRETRSTHYDPNFLFFDSRSANLAAPDSGSNGSRAAAPSSQRGEGERAVEKNVVDAASNRESGVAERTGHERGSGRAGERRISQGLQHLWSSHSAAFRSGRSQECVLREKEDWLRSRLEAHDHIAAIQLFTDLRSDECVGYLQAGGVGVSVEGGSNSAEGREANVAVSALPYGDVCEEPDVKSLDLWATVSQFLFDECPKTATILYLSSSEIVTTFSAAQAFLNMNSEHFRNRTAKVILPMIPNKTKSAVAAEHLFAEAFMLPCRYGCEGLPEPLHPHRYFASYQTNPNSILSSFACVPSTSARSAILWPFQPATLTTSMGVMEEDEDQLVSASRGIVGSFPRGGSSRKLVDKWWEAEKSNKVDFLMSRNAALIATIGDTLYAESSQLFFPEHLVSECGTTDSPIDETSSTSSKPGNSLDIPSKAVFAFRSAQKRPTERSAAAMKMLNDLPTPMAAPSASDDDRAPPAFLDAMFSLRNVPYPEREAFFNDVFTVLDDLDP